MIIDDLFEAPQLCPECGGISFSDLILAEKKDACYYKVKASAKVWPSAYASGRLVQCRKKGAGNYGNKSKNEGMAEARKKKKKQSSRSQGYFFPGYGYYGSGESGEGGGDGGGGESINRGVAEGSIEQQIAHKRKNNPLQASVRQHEYGYTALVTDANTDKPSWFGGAIWQTPELAMGHAKAFVKGFPYLEQEYAQRFVDKNFDGIADQGMAEGELDEKSTSQAQFRTMAAAAHNPEFARKVGIKQSVAREFNRADKGQDYKDLPKKADESKSKPAEKEADYGDDYQAMVQRVKKLAGLGPLKTVYDPNKRVYRNMPTAVQPKK